jgi:regulator of protease activity HflC (stomatin/prohibitin superfamily)
LFENHVPSQNVLEKDELVKSVIRLVEEERAKIRRKEEEEARERELAEAAARAAVEHADHGSDSSPTSPPPVDEAASTVVLGEHTPEEAVTANVNLPPKVQQMATDLERSGLCVICQDEEANIVVVDCG